MKNKTPREKATQGRPVGTKKHITLEYKSLRDEIASNDTSSMQLFTASLIIIAASMGFAFQGVTSPLLRIGSFCAVTGIISIIIWQMLDRIKMTFIIAAYLRVFIEPKLKGINWETRLHIYRKKDVRVADKRQNNLLTIYEVIGCLNLILAIGYTIKSSDALRMTNVPVYQNAKTCIVFNELYLAVLFVALAACIFAFTWVDASEKLKHYIDNNEECIAREWREIL